MRSLMSTTLFALSVLICASPSSALAAEGEVTDAKNGAGLPKHRGAMQAQQAYIASCAADDALLSQCVSNALEAHGAVAISHIAGLASARELALRSLSRCIVGTELHPAMSERVFPDASVRRALFALNGFPEPLPAQGVAGCEQLADTFELRAVVDKASSLFVNALEPLVVRGSDGLLDARDGEGVERAGAYTSLAQIYHASDTHEHFQAFYNPSPSQGDPLTSSAGREPSQAASSELPVHTDDGLFIASIPHLHLEIKPSGDGAMLAHESERAAGFAVDAGDGTLVRISPEHASSTVVFWLGQGWKDWMRPLSRQFNPTPHSATLNTPLGAVRLWYGRTHMLPKNALLPPDAKGSRPTYGEWEAARQALVAARRGIVTDVAHDEPAEVQWRMGRILNDCEYPNAKGQCPAPAFPDCCTSEGTCDTTTAGDSICGSCKPEYCSPPAVEDLPYESLYDNDRGSDLPHCECDGYDNGAFRWMSRMCMTTYEEGGDSICYPTRVGHPGTVLNGRFYSNNCDGAKSMCSPWTRPTVTTPEPECAFTRFCYVGFDDFYQFSGQFLFPPPCCSCLTDTDCEVDYYCYGAAGRLAGPNAANDPGVCTYD